MTRSKWDVAVIAVLLIGVIICTGALVIFAVVVRCTITTIMFSACDKSDIGIKIFDYLRDMVAVLVALAMRQPPPPPRSREPTPNDQQAQTQARSDPGS